MISRSSSSCFYSNCFQQQFAENPAPSPGPRSWACFPGPWHMQTNRALQSEGPMLALRAVIIVFKSLVISYKGVLHFYFAPGPINHTAAMPKAAPRSGPSLLPSPWAPHLCHCSPATQASFMSFTRAEFTSISEPLHLLLHLLRACGSRLGGCASPS